MFIGRAQEKTFVCPAEKRRNPDTGRSYPWIVKTTGMVNHFYMYCLDADFGAVFAKVLLLLPLQRQTVPQRPSLGQRQAAKAGVGFTAMDNAFAAVEDVATVQAICDSFGPVHIYALLESG